MSSIVKLIELPFTNSRMSLQIFISSIKLSLESLFLSIIAFIPLELKSFVTKYTVDIPTFQIFATSFGLNLSFTIFSTMFSFVLGFSLEFLFLGRTFLQKSPFILRSLCKSKVLPPANDLNFEFLDLGIEFKYSIFSSSILDLFRVTFQS